MKQCHETQARLAYYVQLFILMYLQRGSRNGSKLTAKWLSEILECPVDLIESVQLNERTHYAGLTPFGLPIPSSCINQETVDSAFEELIGSYFGKAQQARQFKFYGWDTLDESLDMTRMAGLLPYARHRAGHMGSALCDAFPKFAGRLRYIAEMAGKFHWSNPRTTATMLYSCVIDEKIYKLWQSQSERCAFKLADVDYIQFEKEVHGLIHRTRQYYGVELTVHMVSSEDVKRDLMLAWEVRAKTVHEMARKVRAWKKCPQQRLSFT